MEQRRHDPYPWSWEAPAAAALLAGVVMVLGIHVGRGIACLVSGAGFRWVTADALLTSLGGIFSGDPGAGLTEAVTGVTGRVLATSIIVAEVVFVALLGVLGYWLLVRWGPGAMKGVASPSEAQQLLGRQRLMRARAIIRPDLYATTTTAGRASCPPLGRLPGHPSAGRRRVPTAGPVARPEHLHARVQPQPRWGGCRA